MGERVRRLPASGAAVVISDLHGHVGDFDAVLERSQIVERLTGGEDVYFIVLGDVPDLERHRILDDQVPRDGDVVILDRLIALRDELGSRGDRIVYLEGNHDFHLLRIAREIERELAVALEDQPLPKGVVASYHRSYEERFGPWVFQSNVAPYDGIHRVCRRHLEFIGGGPMLVILEGCQAGLVHAGPLRMDQVDEASWPDRLASIVESRRDALEGLGPEDYYESPYHQLLNNRFRSQDYDLEDLERFCSMLGVGLLISGHTPHSYLLTGDGSPAPGCQLKSHLGWVGERQVVLCTSFGALSRESKVYLELDLSRPYGGPADLRPGEEIRPLYERA